MSNYIELAEIDSYSERHRGRLLLRWNQETKKVEVLPASNPTGKPIEILNLHYSVETVDHAYEDVCAMYGAGEGFRDLYA